MNEFLKTGVVAASAVALAVVATMMGPREIKLDVFADEGQEFFPKFTNADLAIDLEVTEFDETAAELRKFAVRRDAKGSWTIPSHGNYPADGKDRMGKAAAMMIGLRKERVVSSLKETHVPSGVVDPLDAGETKGRGKRVTMKDSAGNVLADLIIGKAVEGKTDVHYVTLPGKRVVYSTKIAGELSTKFADWIETDLLKAQAWDIQKVTFDNYSVDEQKGQVVPGEKLVITKDSAGKWAFEGVDAAKEETNEDKTREVGDSLTGIKIVGVRTKPEGLTAALQQANGIDRQILGQMMAQKGYFLGQGGQLFSNEGDLLFETKKGVRYTLRFGELVPGEGDAITSGAEGAKPNKPKDGETGPVATPANNRYLMVTAEFVESLLQKPTGQRLTKDQLDKRMAARDAAAMIVAAVDAFKAKNEGKLPESLAKLTEKPAEGEALLAELKKDPWDNDYVLQAAGDGFAIVSFGENKAEGGEGAATDVRSDRFPLEDDLKKAADEWTEYDRKVEEGRKEADKLTRRFGPWYYVIDQALFAKLNPLRKDLVKDKAPAAPVVPAPGEPGKEPGK